MSVPEKRLEQAPPPASEVLKQIDNTVDRIEGLLTQLMGLRRELVEGAQNENNDG